MSYAGRSPRYDLPWWDTGEVSSGVWNERISTEVDYLVALLDDLATGAGYDGTVRDGFACSAGAGLSLNVAAGLGMVDGIRIYASGVTAKTLSDDSTLYIYLKLTASSFYDRSFTVEESLSGAGMADAILIAKVITAGGSISSVDNNVSGRTPRLRVPGIPNLRVVAPAGAEYTDPKTAIEACNARDIVLIMPGTYTCAATITVPANNITIMGLSRDGTVLSFTTADANHCLQLNGKDGLTIQGLTVSSVASKTGSVIYGDGSTDLQLVGLRITSVDSSSAIYLVNGARLWLSDCHLSGSPAAWFWLQLFCAQADRLKLIGCRILLSGTNATGSIIYERDSNDWHFVNDDIRVTSPAAGLYLIDMRANIGGTTNNGVRISNCNIRGSGDVGTAIRLYTTAAGIYLDDTHLNDNVIFDFATGVSIADARVRETMLHDNNLHTCTTPYSDSGTNTDIQDNS
jgi:hypothetical protein